MGAAIWRWATPVLAVIGLAIAVYLTLVHYEDTALVCGLGDCHQVQTSEYATVGSIPVALLGVGMFLTVLILDIVRRVHRSISEVASAAILFICLTSLLYYAFLTYLEIWVIEAICQWCVLSSFTVLSIFIIEIVRYVRTPESL